MTTSLPIPLLALQAATIGAADAILAAAGLPTYTVLAARLTPPVGPLPVGVASLDAARASRAQYKRVEGRL